MVELGDQQILPRLCVFAFGDVDRQPPQSDEMPGAVKLGLCRFLEPHFPAVRPQVTEGRGIGGAADVDATYNRFELQAILRVDPFEKAPSAKRLSRIEAEKLRG